MQTRSSTIFVLVLATGLAGAAVPAMGAVCCDVGFAATAPREVLAVLQAPVGHRQLKLDDLPGWLRDIDGPLIEGAKPMQEPQSGNADATQRGEHIVPRRASGRLPNYGTPLICEGC